MWTGIGLETENVCTKLILIYHYQQPKSWFFWYMQSLLPSTEEWRMSPLELLMQSQNKTLNDMKEGDTIILCCFWLSSQRVLIKFSRQCHCRKMETELDFVIKRGGKKMNKKRHGNWKPKNVHQRKNIYFAWGSQPSNQSFPFRLSPAFFSLRHC